MRLSLICEEMNKIAPPSLADDWDNSGLLLGDPGAETNCVAFALEATAATVALAIKKGAGLLVNHHPCWLKPLRSIDFSTQVGNIIQMATKGGLALFAMHTNFDAARGGANDILATLLGLPLGEALLSSEAPAKVKLVTFVPETHVEKVSKAIFEAGGGSIGNYSECSFRAPGHGTFFPEPGAGPFSGKAGAFSVEPELRLEILVPKSVLPAAVDALKATHPYEDVAFDVYRLQAENGPHGHGRLCTPSKPISVREIAEKAKTALKTKNIRIVGNPNRKISRIAICTGSGAFMIPIIRQPEKTCLVTGDLKYHDARLAEERGLSVIDAGHFATEIPFVQAAPKLLSQRIKVLAPEARLKMVTIKSEKDPFTAL